MKTEVEEILDDDDEETIILSLTGEEVADNKNDIAPFLDVRDDEPLPPPRPSAGPSSSKVQLTPPRKRAKVNKRRATTKVKVS